MSTKINIISIVKGHFRSLTNSDNSFNLADCLTFKAFPLLVAIVFALVCPKLSSNTISLLVNFGSIFTALLLSVLVLIFDQESKIDEQYEKNLLYKEQLEKNPELKESSTYKLIYSKNYDEKYPIKKQLLGQLYFNISFSIICALLLVLSCLIYSELIESNFLYVNYVIQIFLFFVIAILITIFLNILMIVKRLHVLLTN
ncbi:hypothetical protein KVY11_16375 [Acinetobacter sp. CWB-G5]|uniref:hypothetical protein n=1 Tax=Acinetobacter sp. CWB-G5 TaxID=2855444 RepID=UPI001C453E0B|nr:hypothetical protein [Acinetobacter sp. CWB-G5]MBV7310242.1 hypothetical protein [Acinetobacter sp. CWB-G5]